MRPVNLIPPEERRGDRAPLRTGALPYVLVGTLVVALALIALVVLTGNQINDRENELADLQAEQSDAQARADALEPYANLASLSSNRSTTVTSLAQSRFDWDRVLRELALVIPDNVWLTQMSGTVSPDVRLEGAADIAIRNQAAGPALSIVGCASSHAAVAEFLQALRDVDGVTRVGIATDARPTAETGAADTSASDDDCRTRKFISKFEIVASFDAVPVSAPAATATGVAPTTPAAPATPTGDDGGVSGAQAQEQQVRDSTAQQTDKADKAVNIIPGVAR